MSFSFQFSAADKYDALRKLHDAYAPAAVKAVIEMALQGLPHAPAFRPSTSTSGKAEAGASSSSSSRPPELRGVFVEAWGHIDEGTCGESKIERLVVKPLLA
jgi:hypothetical protein